MYFKCSYILLFVISCVSARIHNIQIKNDNRKFIRLSHFAFNNAGNLHIKLSNFTSHPDKQHFFFGLTFDRIRNDGLNTYLNREPNRCIILEKILEEKFVYSENAPIIFFPFDLRNKKIKLQCSESFNDIQITNNVTLCSEIELPLSNYVLNNKNNYYNIEFSINMKAISHLSMYNVFFHNCMNYEDENKVLVDFNVEIQERNGENYLSADENNLPKLYCIFALLYFLAGTSWVFLLWKRKSAVLKIHYLMGVLMYLKFVSILLNYINYKYIEKIGEESAVWSSFYYIFDFFWMIFLFTTIILISSGWTIIKTNLKRKIKIILVLVIVLQITANITRFYLHKTDTNDKEYKKLKELFLISDLLSCILTVFPAIWTLKQLKRNSELEGDESQLIMFRKLFILLIICIYFTRIFYYLIQLIVAENVPYAWFPTLFQELTYFVCFILIGFIFRPIINSYLTAISDDVNDIDSGLKDNFNKFNENWTSATNIINLVDDSEEEEESLLSEIKRAPLL